MRRLMADETTVVAVARCSRAGVASFVGILALALAGCGSGGNALKQVVDAANNTRSLSRTSYLLTLEGQRLSVPPVAVSAGKAAYDLKAGVGYEALTVKRPGPGKHTIYLDFVPTGVFVAPWPTPAGLLPPGRIWISVGLAGDRAPGADNPLPAQLEGLSPELPLDEIAWGARSATSIGTPTVNHVPMHSYRVSVDLAKALSVAKGAGRRAIAAAIESQLHATPSGRTAITVFVTGPGHIGRIETAPSPVTRLGKPTFQFTSFDAQFNRARPRASQTVPLASISTPSSDALWTIATS
jgi:hypothetical protein